MTDAAVMPKMFLSVFDIFWRRCNRVGSIFSANGDLVLHVLGHFTFDRSGFADAAAGKNQSTADNNRDSGCLHESDSDSFMNFSQSKSQSTAHFSDYKSQSARIFPGKKFSCYWKAICLAW